MLVLLIIFMVTATLMKVTDESPVVEGMNLPQTSSTNQVNPDDVAHLILRIDENLVVMFGAGNEVITDCSGALAAPSAEAFRPCLDELQQKLGENRMLQEEKKIFILADMNIPYGFVVGALARIRLAGVDEVGMVTNRELMPASPTNPN
jgi:biopolymer transport protein TolR